MAKTFYVEVSAPGYQSVEQIHIDLDDPDPQMWEYEAEFQARLQIADRHGYYIHDVRAVCIKEIEQPNNSLRPTPKTGRELGR